MSRTAWQRLDPSLAAIVAEGFLSRLSFGILSFALPVYAFRELGLSLAAIGVLVSLNLTVAIALKPAMGALADRVGMKRCFAASIAMRSAVSLLLVFAAAPGSCLRFELCTGSRSRPGTHRSAC